MKNKRQRNIIILVIAAFLFLLLVTLPLSYPLLQKVFFPSNRAEELALQTPLDEEKLYEDALEDLGNKRYEDAVGKLQQLVAANPGYKDAKEKLNEAERLREEQGGSSGNVAGNNSGGNSGGGSNPGGGNSSSNNNGNGGGANLKEIPSDATPLSILPETIDGYSTQGKGWVSKPKTALGKYEPEDKDVRQEIEVVFLKTGKYDNANEAENAYNSEKELFPISTENLNVNGHSSHFGLYNEGRPDLFPPLANLCWMRDNWVFSITVFPGKGTPSTEYKKQIALDVANKFGY